MRPASEIKAHVYRFIHMAPYLKQSKGHAYFHGWFLLYGLSRSARIANQGIIITWKKCPQWDSNPLREGSEIVSPASSNTTI